MALEVIRELRPYVERIGKVDVGLASQLKRCSASVVLNMAEGNGTRGRRRRNSYEVALGEAREVRAALDVAEAAGYVPQLGPALCGRLDHIIGVLVKIVH